MDFFIDLIESAGQKTSLLKLNPVTDDCPKVVWIKKGIAKIFGINDSGIKVNTDLIFEGELYLITKNNYRTRDLFFLETLKYSEMYSIPLAYFNQMQAQQISEKLMYCYNQRLQRIHQQKVKNFDLALADRILYLLADFCRIYGTQTANNYVMPNFFIHEDLASILKTCRQNITSQLIHLKRSGLLFYNRKEIRFEKVIFEKSKPIQETVYI